MKITRFAAVMLAAAGLVSASRGQSQPPSTPPPMGQHGYHGMTPEERFNRLSDELNLTDEQKPKVQAVFDEMRQKLQAAMHDARTNADAQLQDILTPEQYQKLQGMWQQHQHHFEHHPGGGGSSTNDNSGQ